MARIPYPVKPIADPDVRAFMAAIPPLNLLRMESHAEGVVEHIVRLSNAIWTKTTAPLNLRLVASIRAAEAAGSPYEVAQLANVVRAFGVEGALIDAAREGSRSSLLDSDERLVAALAEELAAGAEASAETLAAMRGRFEPRIICELIVAIGFYLMQSRVIETLGIELEDQPVEFPVNMGAIS